MRLGRVRYKGRTYLARASDREIELVRTEDDRPTSDALRDALATADLATLDVIESVDPDDCRVLAPLRSPGKFLAVGLNYVDHAAESATAPPTSPLLFSKASSSIVGPDDDIIVPTDETAQVDYEVELALVIARPCRKVSVAQAADNILGYTVCNDISARDAQFQDGQWHRGKSFDTFGPLGPWIVDGLGGAPDLAITCMLNGEVMQADRTSSMAFSPSEIVAYVSRFMTLLPGDVIATGTPPGVGFARSPAVYLNDGDTLVCEIEGIGQLRNAVVSR